MEQLGLNLGYLLVQIVCFFIIFVVVRAWIVKPLRTMLEKRRKTISQGLEDAAKAADARASAEKDAAAIVTEAQARAAQIVHEATQRAETAAKEVKAAAEQETVKERENSMAEARQERDSILADLRGQVAALSIAAAQKLIGESLDEKRQHLLINEFFSGVKSGKVVVLEGEILSGETAQVTSALPLTKGEQDTVRDDVIARMGNRAEVEFRVDPAILGGLVVRVGEKVLDGSVQAQLEELRKSLK